ncbi:MAG: DUF427 domain-containing protein [Sphingomonas sp.]|jgi:uncharacterized protein (DUF427 family)
MVKAVWNGVTIAESDNTVVVERNHYFPRSSVSPAYLTDSGTTTVCSWKGTASYHNIVVDGQTNANAAWYYPEPKQAAAEIIDHIAFWKGVQVG